jgi:hypothetical protein
MIPPPAGRRDKLTDGHGSRGERGVRGDMTRTGSARRAPAGGGLQQVGG